MKRIAPVGQAFEQLWQSGRQNAAEKSMYGCINPDKPHWVVDAFKTCDLHELTHLWHAVQFSRKFSMLIEPGGDGRRLSALAPSILYSDAPSKTFKLCFCESSSSPFLQPKSAVAIEAAAAAKLLLEIFSPSVFRGDLENIFLYV